MNLGNKKEISKGIVKPANAIDASNLKIGSPEIYFGSGRNEYLANGNRGVSGTQNFQIPQTILQNNLYLGGSWNIQKELAESQGPVSIVFNYKAKDVYMVASSDKPITLHIYIDGVKKKDVIVSENTLYTLVEGTAYGEHSLKIETDEAGLKAFTFTFG